MKIEVLLEMGRQESETQKPQAQGGYCMPCVKYKYSPCMHSDMEASSLNLCLVSFILICGMWQMCDGGCNDKI